MVTEVYDNLKSIHAFSGSEKLKKAEFYPLVKDKMYRIMFSRKHKNFISYFLSSLLNLDYNYVYNNIEIANSVLVNEKTNEVTKTVDLICRLDDNFFILEMNGQALFSTLKRNKTYLYKVLGSYLKTDDKRDEDSTLTEEEKKLRRYKRIYLININNFYPSTAKETLDIEETVIIRKDKLLSYGKDYEIYDIYLPLIHDLWYTNNKLTEIDKKRTLEKWEEFLLVTLEDDSEELQKIIKKEDIYMEYREKAKEASDELNLDFSWASIEADEEYKPLELAEARELGLSEGKSLGLAEGEERGIEQTKKATAKELYKNHVSMNIIQKVTGFSEAQIRNICL